METLYLTSYTQLEKYHILKEHLLPKQMKKHALSRAMLSVKDDALREIISAYTREAGVRNLEREAATVCRKAAVHYLKTGKKSAVTKENLSAYLGPPKYLRELLPETDQVGIANGLAYTSVGGELLFVEVNVMPGSGKAVSYTHLRLLRISLFQYRRARAQSLSGAHSVCKNRGNIPPRFFFRKGPEFPVFRREIILDSPG